MTPASGPNPLEQTMNRNHIRMLTWLVERYDDGTQPVTSGDVATHFEIDVDTAQACLETLEENHLLTTVPDEGHRPTVTAHELLELDIDDESVLILDTNPDE
jgi:predicted transcriptional regulator